MSTSALESRAIMCPGRRSITDKIYESPKTMTRTAVQDGPERTDRRGRSMLKCDGATGCCIKIPDTITLDMANEHAAIHNDLIHACDEVLAASFLGLGHRSGDVIARY